MRRQILGSFQLLLLASTAMFAWHWFQAVYFQTGYPNNTFVFRSEDPFGDYLWLHSLNANFDLFVNRFRTYGANYPAFGHLLVTPFTSGPYLSGLVAYELVLAASLGLLAFTIIRRAAFSWIESAVIVAALILCYPALFCFERANLESILFATCVLAFVALMHRKRRWFLILITVAAAAKVYPILFLFAAFQGKRLVKYGLIAGLAAFCLNVLAAYIFRGNLPLLFSHYAEVAPAFKEFILTDLSSISRNNSLYALIRSGLQIFGVELQRPAAETFMGLYSAVAGALSVAAVIYLYFSKLRMRQKLSFLIAIILLAPQLSFDYKLIYLLLPFSLLMSKSAFRIGEYTPVRYLILFILIFKGYYYFERDLSAAAFLNPVAILILLYFCTRKKPARLGT